MNIAKVAHLPVHWIFLPWAVSTSSEKHVLEKKSPDSKCLFVMCCTISVQISCVHIMLIYRIYCLNTRIYVPSFLQTGDVNTAIQPCILVLFCTNFGQYIQKLAIFLFSFPPLLFYVVFIQNFCVTLMTVHPPLIFIPWQFSKKSWAISLMTGIQVPEA